MGGVSIEIHEGYLMLDCVRMLASMLPGLSIKEYEVPSGRGQRSPSGGGLGDTSAASSGLRRQGRHALGEMRGGVCGAASHPSAS